MSAAGLRSDDRALVDQLIDAYPFKPYRNHRFLPRPRQTRVMRAELDRLLAMPDHIASVTGTGDAAAVAICHPLAWDTAFFGVPMARLDLLLRGPDADRSQLAAAAGAVLIHCRNAGLRHVAAKVDVADADAVAVLQDLGFRLMDTLVCYISHPKRPAPRRVKEVGRVRPFAASDADQVMEITRQAYKDFHGRFHLDPHLPRERSDAFYLEWAARCLDGRMADRVYVSEGAEGRLYAWASVRLVEPVSSAGGTPVFAGSLGATRPDRPGAYAALIGTAARDNHAAGALTEAQTQSDNFPMVRVLEAVGAQYARAEYTFHAWLA